MGALNFFFVYKPTIFQYAYFKMSERLMLKAPFFINEWPLKNRCKEEGCSLSDYCRAGLKRFILRY